MTNQHPITPLSSAAQAVWRAHEQVFRDECVLTKTDMKALAAALRAAAYRITPAVPEITSCCLLREQKIRHLLLTIANELEDDG